MTAQPQDRRQRRVRRGDVHEHHRHHDRQRRAAVDRPRLPLRPTSMGAVAVGYLVSLAVVIPASGWLGDRFGHRRVLLLGDRRSSRSPRRCAGWPRACRQLVFFRVLQGIGGGMLTPVGMALLFRTFPPAERVRASSILTVPDHVGARRSGPVLGGVLVTGLSWRWVFLVNLPIGAARAGLRPDVPGRSGAGPRRPVRRDGLRAVRHRLRRPDVRHQRGPERGWGSRRSSASLVLGRSCWSRWSASSCAPASRC